MTAPLRHTERRVQILRLLSHDRPLTSMHGGAALDCSS